jgi:hypothetical protein
MKPKEFLLAFAVVSILSMSPFECQASSLAVHSVNVAGISLGMSTSQVKAAHPRIRIFKNTADFRGIKVRFFMGELKSVGGNSEETLFLYFDSPVDREPRVLKVVYWVGFDGDGQTILETAVEINNAKEALIKKYGTPDLYKDDAPDTYITYNIQRPGGIQGEVVLAAKVTRSAGTSSMSGLLQLELTDKSGLLRQQTQWIQNDVEVKIKKKDKKLHF